MGHDVLEDVLVLRVENDQDYYIHMRANYVMSCFGQSLENLIRMKQPGTNETPCWCLARESEEITMSAPVAMAIPKELWRMVDYLLHAGCDTTGLWTDKGVEGEDTIIRDALDEGTAFPSIE